MTGAAILAAWTAAVPAAAHVGAAAQASLRPTADAHVTRSGPRRAHGHAATLRAGPSPAARAYVRFKRPAGTVGTAALRIYTRERTRGRLAVRTVLTPGRWSERRVRRRPSLGRTVAVTPRLRGKGWAVLDVTSAVVHGRRIELALVPRRGARIRIASRESARAPRLAVQWEGVAGPGGGTPGRGGGTPFPPMPGGSPGDPPVIAGAGDIADDGNRGEPTAKVLDALNPDVVITTGDNAYESGSAAEYQSFYEPTWGRHKAKTRPVPGNHEYATPGAAGYFGYFGARAGEAGKGYYAYDLGGWRLYALNSNIDTDAGSAQEQWLRADLAANPRPCVLAYWHHPRFSGGKYPDDADTEPLWRALYDAGAEVVLAGHDHNYQHFRPMRPDGGGDAARGIRSFVLGMGGKNHIPVVPDARRVTADDTTFGVLAVTLRPDGYDWRFVPEAGGAFSDSGSDRCH